MILGLGNDRKKESLRQESVGEPDHYGRGLPARVQWIHGQDLRHFSQSRPSQFSSSRSLKYRSSRSLLRRICSTFTVLVKWGAVRGEQLQLPRRPVAAVDHRDRSLPRRLLSAVHFPQLKHLPMRHLVTRIPLAPIHRPALMNFFVFTPCAAFQKHVRSLLDLPPLGYHLH